MSDAVPVHLFSEDELKAALRTAARVLRDITTYHGVQFVDTAAIPADWQVSRNWQGRPYTWEIAAALEMIADGKLRPYPPRESEAE